MKTYSEKLRDPRWQRKRLEIMQRDNFTCTQCGDFESTLNIHHWKYNGEPWDAGDENLTTVCEICHKYIEIDKKFNEEMLHSASLHLNHLSFRHPTGARFRFLQVGEIIKDGDEWYNNMEYWCVFGRAIGQPYSGVGWAARRKII